MLVHQKLTITKFVINYNLEFVQDKVREKESFTPARFPLFIFLISLFSE